jgi:TatD DNase family protein
MMKLVDTHTHLEAVDNVEEVLEHAKSAGVDKIITVGTTLLSSRIAIDISEKRSTEELKIYAAVGLHPFDCQTDIAEKGLKKCVEELEGLATTSKKIVAIGEAGLDFYGPGDKRPQTVQTEREFQFKLFGGQLKIAEKLNLPIIIHCRNGWDDIFRVMSVDFGPIPKRRGVFHSFTGGINDAKNAVNLGFYVSFSGIVTFKNGSTVQEAVKIVPIDKILVETDSPFLAPEPFRGQKNESANVKITASFLANLLKIKEDDFSSQTSKNAQNLFGLW